MLTEISILVSSLKIIDKAINLEKYRELERQEDDRLSKMSYEERIHEANKKLHLRMSR